MPELMDADDLFESRRSGMPAAYFTTPAGESGPVH